MLDAPERGRLLYQTTTDGEHWETERTFEDTPTRLEVNETMETNHEGSRSGHVRARYKRTV